MVLLENKDALHTVCKLCAEEFMHDGKAIVWTAKPDFIKYDMFLDQRLCWSWNRFEGQVYGSSNLGLLLGFGFFIIVIFLLVVTCG